MLLLPLLLLSDAILLPAWLSAGKMKAVYVADNTACEHSRNYKFNFYYKTRLNKSKPPST